MWGQLPEMKLCILRTLRNMAIYFLESALIKDQIRSTWLNIEKLITYDHAVMVHEILKEICTENLKVKVMRRTQISKYETHRINHLQVSMTS